jgi:hypothetical protein
MPYTFTYSDGAKTRLTGLTYTGGSTEAVLESTVVNIATANGGGASATLAAVNATAATGLKVLGNSAFQGCSLLTSFTFPTPVQVSSIGTNAFLGCAFKTFDWPNSVGTMNNSIFHTNSQLTGVNIPSIVTSIGINMFYRCRALQTFVWPSTANVIGGYGFYECTSLTNITIGDNVVYIGPQVFYGCTQLNSMIIPNGVTAISNDGIFDFCSGLTSISYGTSLTSAGTGYGGCTSVTNVRFNRLQTPLTQMNINNMFMPFNITSSYPSYLNLLAMLQQGYTTGDLAFAGFNAGAITAASDNNQFTYTYLDSNVKTQISSVSYSGVGFTSATPFFAVTSIGANAFSTASVTSVLTAIDFTLSTKLSNIGSSAFQSCTALNSISVPNTITSIGSSAFQSSGIRGFSWSNNANIIDNSTFQSCTSLTSATIPSNVTNIGSSVFQSCSALTSVTVPNTITSIGTSAFQSSGIKGFSWSNNANIINNSTFQSCTSLTEATIPSNVTNIGSSVFQSCSALTSVIVPNTITSIGSSAFQNCAIPTFGWPSNTLAINDSTFYNCTLLTNITNIPNTVTSVGIAAFSRCGFKYLSWWPTGTTLIDDSTFSYCSNLTSIYIPTDVNSIDTLAFDNCTSLTNIILPFYTKPTKIPLASQSFSNTTAINGSNYNTLTRMIQDGGYTTAELTTAGFDATAVSLAAAASCFNEGTKILCFKNNYEEYIPIQDLRKGDIVKTYLHGYKKIDLIGKAQLRNNATNKWKNNMFVMHKTPENKLTEDLIMTGGHSILVDELKRDDFREERIGYYEIQKSNPWKIDDKHLLLAGVSKFFEEIPDNNLYTYCNFTLESDGDDEKRYGIWANGILAEIPSKTQFLSFNEYELL